MNNQALNSLCPLPIYGPIFDWDWVPSLWDSKKEWANGQVYPLIVPCGQLPTAQAYLGTTHGNLEVYVYHVDTGARVATLPYNGLFYTIETIPGADSEYMAVFLTDTETYHSQLNLPEGRYYLVINDGGDYYWYSDIFTYVKSVSAQSVPVPMDNYIELAWRNINNFTTDDGAIVYSLNRIDRIDYWNKVYIMSDIGKPEYKFEEEGSDRDGYFFPFRQISKKVYRFNFLAPEYLCDSLRLVRMADLVTVKYKGLTYGVRNFNPVFEWQEGGWLASVEVEFETNTVAKKVGYGDYVKVDVTRGEDEDNNGGDDNNDSDDNNEE